MDFVVSSLCLCTSNFGHPDYYYSALAFLSIFLSLWLMGWSVRMSNSLQISLGRRFPRFLFHVAFLLRQSPSSLFWMSMVFFALCDIFNRFLRVMSLGSPPRKSSRSTSTLLFDPASRNSSPLSPRTSMLRFGHVWTIGNLDTFLKFCFLRGCTGRFNSRGVVPDVLILGPSSPKKSPTSLKNTKHCKMPAPENLFSTKIKSYLSMTCPVSVFEILLFQGIIPFLGVALTLLASSITSQKPFIHTSIIWKMPHPCPIMWRQFHPMANNLLIANIIGLGVTCIAHYRSPDIIDPWLCWWHLQDYKPWLVA